MQREVINEDHAEFQRLLGYELVEWRKGYAVLELPVTTKLLNRAGKVHGGVLCTLVDTSCGFAGCYPLSETEVPRCVTLTLNTSFIGPVTGEKIRALGEVQGGGKRIFFAKTVIYNDDGSLVATGEGSFSYRGTFEVAAKKD
ncbi:MAG: PaaI family thioesterase [Rhodospirillales bacterium]|nr:PaaI family thioesterase [Rhodospirillales bacterium]